jgi:hypothetical protein
MAVKASSRGWRLGCGVLILAVVVAPVGAGDVDVTCPPGGLLEGEPVCFDDYVDQFNSGCGGEPPVFSDAACGAVICGTAGTFVQSDVAMRDTDWYALVLDEPTLLTVRITAEHEVQFGIVDNEGIDDCGHMAGLLIVDVTEPGVLGTIVVSLDAGSWWIWTASAAFDGVPCGSEYVLEVCCDPPWQMGDMNCDGLVSAADIDGFVLALVGGPDGYGAQYPACRYLNGDMNGDSTVSAADIDGFVNVIHDPPGVVAD